MNIKHPLRGAGDDTPENPLNPEALLISAYLDQGSFTPEAQRIDSADITGWGKLWKWCMDYQHHSNKAPPMVMLTKYFPEFEYTPDVNVHWAADQVRNAAGRRGLRAQIHSSLNALNAEDLPGAYGALDKLKRPQTAALEPTDVFDHSTITTGFSTSHIGVPFPSLMRATDGGIGPGEFWVIGARLGQGKTWMMLMYAVEAAKRGYHVCFHALEMPAWQVARRSHQLMTNNSDILALLRSDDLTEHKRALDHIKDDMSINGGTLEILDPSHGRINTTGAVAESCQRYDLVLVDHAGLMISADGHRAIEDWRVQATVSNIFRETTLATGTPIIASAQVKRAGETTGNKPPKASDLAQSDALGQDADVVIMSKRLNDLVMTNSGQKIRNGPTLDWFSRFDVKANRFEEISQAVADRISLQCDDIAHR